jgi:hypothetical protein
MENQKRILNFSEFTNAYAKGDRFDASGNEEKDVDKLQASTDSLTTSDGTVPGSKGDMDSVSSKPASRFIKTDYKKSPAIPNGPVKLKDVETEKGEEKAEKTKAEPKKLKKTKETSKKSDENEREESGEY